MSFTMFASQRGWDRFVTHRQVVDHSIQNARDVIVLGGEHFSHPLFGQPHFIFGRDDSADDHDDVVRTLGSEPVHDRRHQ